MADTEFFVAKKAAAVLKHGILSSYVLPFVTKTGSTSKDARVVVLDGYAGEGRYDDGSPGSPIFMTETAREVAAPRKMELHFVEEKKKRFDKLNEVLNDEAADVDWKTYKGSVEKYLDEILASAEGVPFFGFLDPCGLGLSFDDVVKKIFARPHGQYTPGTEVLINFSADAVRRTGGRIKEAVDAPGRQATLDHMDAVCGGDWWQDVYTNAASPEEASALIASGYFERLVKATDAGGWVIEVRNKPHHQPKYTLVFLSRHPDGLMVMGEALSLSQERWRAALVQPDEMPGFHEMEEEALVANWIKQMKENVKKLLVSKTRFLIRTEYRTVMAGVLGDARMTHLRKALKELKKEGVVSSPGTGSPLWEQWVYKA